MASAMGPGHRSPGSGGQGINKAALAAAAHSVQAHRVYVGNLPYGVRWKELKEFMREAGEVSFAEVLLGSDGRSRGCGVVEFSTGEAARKAVSELTNRPLLGRPVIVNSELVTDVSLQRLPIPSLVMEVLDANCRSKIPASVTWQTLKEMFRSAGTVIRADVNDSTRTGTVLMSSEAEATAAIATFNGSSLEGSCIVVRQKQPADPVSPAPSTQLFVNNLPYSTNSAGLLALSPTATNAEVMMMGDRSKGIGVLQFSSLEASAEALTSLHAHMVDGRSIIVRYNERWHDFSRPAVGAGSEQTAGAGPEQAVGAGPEQAVGAGPEQAVGAGPEQAVGASSEQAVGDSSEQAASAGSEQGRAGPEKAVSSSSS